jgi:hypothetical protein
MKKMTMLTCCAAALLFSCKKSSTGTANDELLGPQANKVLHYSFNGNLSDGSGNGLGASDSFNISYAADRFGRANQAAVFGGASNPSVILTPSLGSKISGLPMAVSLWFKAVSVNTAQVLVKSDGFEKPNASGFRIALGYRPGQIGFTFGDKTSSSGTNYVVTPQNVVSADTWTHMVVNVRAANDFDFYINGVKNTNCTIGGTATSMVFYPAPVRGIIGNDELYNIYYQGALDDYRVFTKVLSQEEVSALYNFHP